MTTQAIRGALADLARAGRAPASRNRVRSTTGSLCRWLVRRGLLGTDPTVEIERPAQPRRLPVALPDAQLGAVLAAASTPDPAARRPWPERDRALVAVLAGAGLRASELCGADLTDLTADPTPPCGSAEKATRTGGPAPPGSRRRHHRLPALPRPVAAGPDAVALFLNSRANASADAALTT